MKRLALLLLLAPAISYAQPVLPGGIRQVQHDASLSGHGTVASPLTLRTDCATDEGLTYDGATWVCTSGATVTGTGAANSVARWTSASALGTGVITDDGTNVGIGDTTPDFKLDVAGTLGVDGAATIGTATTLAHAINGRAALTSTVSTAHAFHSTLTATAGVTNGRAALAASTNGTYDTTAAARDAMGVRSEISATRSAGANDLTTYAGLFSATGGQVNIALRTSSGSNYFNVSDGSTGVGYASGAALPAKLSVSGTFDATGAATFGSTIIATDSIESQNDLLANDSLTVTNHSTLGSDDDTQTKIHGKTYTLGTAPAISSCGTSPSIDGTDGSGTVTIGSGTATSCTLTFATAYDTNTPHCTVTANTNWAVPLYFSARSTSAFTVTTSTGINLADGEFNYVCQGRL